MEQPQEPQSHFPPDAITLGMGKMTESDEKVWGLVTHLSGLVIPIIGPLVVYLLHKEESPFVTRHAKEALNFHLSFLIWMSICFVTIWLVIPALVLFALMIMFIIFSIVGGVKAHDGKFTPLPITLSLIK